MVTKGYKVAAPVVDYVVVGKCVWVCVSDELHGAVDVDRRGWGALGDLFGKQIIVFVFTCHIMIVVTFICFRQRELFNI